MRDVLCFANACRDIHFENGGMGAGTLTAQRQPEKRTTRKAVLVYSITDYRHFLAEGASFLSKTAYSVLALFL